MELTIKRENLLKPLQLISSAIDKKQTLPILSNILLKVKDDQLTMVGTDLEIELIKTIGLEGNSEEAEVAVPAKKLHDICKALPANALLHFVRQNNQMVLRSAKSRFVLTLLSAADFPTVEKTGEPKFSFEISKLELKRLFEKTHFAMALQDVRYFLNGLLLDIQGDVCTAVTTDGHRLASVSMTLAASQSSRHQVLIPRKAILELIKLLHTENADEIVKISVGENYVSATCDDFEFTSKLIDGRFPEYRALIPQNSDKIATIDRHVLRDALSRVAILSNEKYRGAWFNFESGKLVLQTNNPDKDEAEEELVVEYDGGPLRLGCNVNYVLDVLAVLETDFVKLMLTDTNSSILIEATEGDGQYVVMPMCL